MTPLICRQCDQPLKACRCTPDQVPNIIAAFRLAMFPDAYGLPPRWWEPPKGASHE